MEEIMKCPYCGEDVLAVAKKCKHCGEWLDKSANNATSNVIEVLRSKFSISVEVFAGTIGVILFSLLNWIKISILGINITATLFGISNELNKGELRYFLDGSTEFTLIRIVSVILVIVMLLSFVMLIISLLMNPQSKSKLAYSGFGLIAIVSAIFIVAMIYIYIEEKLWISTVFPFLTLAVAIVAMIFVKRPTKEEEWSEEKEMQRCYTKDSTPEWAKKFPIKSHVVEIKTKKQFNVIEFDYDNNKFICTSPNNNLIRNFFYEYEIVLLPEWTKKFPINSHVVEIKTEKQFNVIEFDYENYKFICASMDNSQIRELFEEHEIVLFSIYSKNLWFFKR